MMKTHHCIKTFWVSYLKGEKFQQPLSPYVYIRVLAYTDVAHQVMPRGHTKAYLRWTKTIMLLSGYYMIWAHF